MNKDFERCCSFLADMIIKYAPEIKEEVEVYDDQGFNWWRESKQIGSSIDTSELDREYDGLKDRLS